jgi:hypothetical protein
VISLSFVSLLFSHAIFFLAGDFTTEMATQIDEAAWTTPLEVITITGQQGEELDDDSNYGSLMGGADPPNANDPPDDIDSEEDEDQRLPADPSTMAESRTGLGTETVNDKLGQWVGGHFVDKGQDPTVQLRAQQMTRVGYLILPPVADQSSVVVSRRGSRAVSFRFRSRTRQHTSSITVCFLFQFSR